jgi:nitroimidazol reductase NimA-like FMN-containing flavoprotein (pyridoxamine 5'-phosphate oxidase superfamily)
MMTGMAEQVVTWSDVVARFDAARNAWFGTVDHAGAPHAVPIWTASVDEVLYVFGERRSVKFCNLATNPRVVVNLESGDEVVIVRGTAYDLGTPAQVPEVVAAFAAKYTEPDDLQWLPEADPSVDLVARIAPSVALLWSSDDYFGTKRRWQAA